MKESSLTIANRQIKAYENQGLIYPVAPIEEFTRFQLTNLSENTVKDVYLEDFLTTDLMVFLVKIDLPTDNFVNLQDGVSPAENTPVVNVEMNFRDVGTIDGGGRQLGAVRENLRLNHGDFLNPITGLFLPKDKALEIKCDKNLSSITYFCTPVYQSSLIVASVNDRNAVDP